MSCIHCGFVYFMTPCLVCNTNYYCHYCVDVIKSCGPCSQLQCNKCKSSNLLNCSICNSKYCDSCVNEHVTNTDNTKCIHCILFEQAIQTENEQTNMEVDL
jgi:hypothetical protein